MSGGGGGGGGDDGSKHLLSLSILISHVLSPLKVG